LKRQAAPVLSLFEANGLSLQGHGILNSIKKLTYQKLTCAPNLAHDCKGYEL
jgi:hypothetical protein